MSKNDASEQSELSPETLEKYFASGTTTTHRVNDSPEILLRIDSLAQSISVLTPHSGMLQDTASLRRLQTWHETFGGQQWGCFTVDARRMYAEAYGLALSVVRAIQNGSSFPAATSAAMVNMKTLLQAKPHMSEAKQIGLFGELLLLRSLLEQNDEYAVLEWWLGPLAEEHDFAFPAFDAEVKTTLSETRSHIIHGAGQLEPAPGRPLWLISIQITRAGGAAQGMTLPGLIDSILEQLSGTRERFTSHLTSEGWNEGDEAMYPTGYLRRGTPAAYLVDDDFPALTPARIQAVVPYPELVSSVSYRVNVSARTAGDPGTPLTPFLSHNDPPGGLT